MPPRYLAPQELRTYFTTFSTADRQCIFRPTAHAELMVTTLLHYRAQQRFELHGFVVMPDHLHVLLTPAPEVPLEKVIQYIKGGFSFRLKKRFEVWERGHFDKRVPDRAAYEACITYIHRNPVVARLAEAEETYPFSSATCMSDMDPMPVWMAQG